MRDHRVLLPEKTWLFIRSNQQCRFGESGCIFVVTAFIDLVSDTVDSFFEYGVEPNSQGQDHQSDDKDKKNQKYNVLAAVLPPLDGTCGLFKRNLNFELKVLSKLLCNSNAESALI